MEPPVTHCCLNTEAPLPSDIQGTSNCTISFTAIEEIGYTVVIPTICSVGIVCNLLTIVILVRKRHDSSSYVYLLGLATADLTTVTCAWPIFLSRCTDCYSSGLSGYSRRVFEVYLYIPVTNVSTAASIWTTISLAIERFVYVQHPLTFKEVCTIPCAKRIVSVIFGFAILFNIPYFFANSIGGECNMMETSTIGEKSFFTFFYWAQAISMYIIPLVLLSTMNCLLIRSLQQECIDKHECEKLSSEKYGNIRKSQNRLTTILITIVFIFLFGNIPIIFAFKGIAVYLFENLSDRPYRNFRLVANVLELVSLSMNFIIYCAIDKKFQAEIVATYKYITEKVGWVKRRNQHEYFI